MKTKYSAGDIVFSKQYKKLGQIKQVLHFFNEHNMVVYKVTVDDKILLFMEEQLEKLEKNA